MEESEKKEEKKQDSEKEQKEIEERKEKIKKTFSSFNKTNWIFYGILILAIGIRLYYFFLTKSQPLWWDEADYLAYAKNLAGFPTDWIVTEKHLSLFPFIAAIFLKVTSNEAILRFLLAIIPSILLVFLTYYVCTVMYKDKRIALISSLLMAVLWEMLFDSFRFQIDNPALLIAFLAIFVFWQGYERKEKIFGKINSHWAIPLSVFLVILTYSIRKSYALFGVFLLIYMLSTRSIKELIKDKYNWIGLALSIVLLFLTQTFLFHSTSSGATSDAFGSSWDLVPLQIFGVFFNTMDNGILSILTYLFWIGFAILVFNLFLSFSIIRKSESKESRADLFNFISLILTLIFFIFLTRNGNLGDPRWYFPLLLPSFICISKSTLIISDFFKSYYKPLGIIVIALLIGFGGYYELQHSDLIIKNKMTSYEGIKEAGLYLKEISNINDIIVSVPVPQTAYYSERKSYSPAGLFNDSRPNSKVTFDDFLDNVNKNSSIKYILVSFSEPGHPDWMVQVFNSKWQIPFMDTSIDFQNNVQDIKEEKTYGNITFKLLVIKQEVFIYEIVRG